MAGDIDWLSVLQTVFKNYGTQLHRNQVNHTSALVLNPGPSCVFVGKLSFPVCNGQVKKFAAKVARKQGRTEDKKHLQKVFKSFLQTET